MNIPEIVAILVNSGIDLGEAKIEVRMMIEHYCQYSALDVIRGVTLDRKKLDIVIEKAQYRAKTRMPIQYIMGVADFMRNKYIVNENVLIPRGDTEQLVLKAIDIIKSNNFKKVLDIGTGSACIACSIASSTDTKITAVDISSKAIEIAKQNAKNLKVNNRIEFIESNLFDKIPSGKKFDIIVSNPPYIPTGTDIQKEVTFEPTGALFAGGENGLEFYEKIISKAPEYLNPNGFIAFELGFGQSDDVLKLLQSANFKNIMIEKDMIGIDRIIYGQL